MKLFICQSGILERYVKYKKKRVKGMMLTIGSSFQVLVQTVFLHVRSYGFCPVLKSLVFPAVPFVSNQLLFLSEREE